MSYDSPEILKKFSDRRKIRFPLLSDAGSKVIRDFGILNEAVPVSNQQIFGIPHPVTFIVDRKGAVVKKYAEQDYRQRQTLAGVLAKDYKVAPAAAKTEVAAQHVKLHLSSSTDTVAGGHRILLAIDVEMRKGLHVYAPGTEGYIPVDWKMKESPGWIPHEVQFPKSKIVYLKAIKEKVPVYEGKIRLVRDITIGQDRDLKPLLIADGNLVVEGTFRYQACEERICYPPETVPIKWTLRREAMDSTRAK